MTGGNDDRRDDLPLAADQTLDREAADGGAELRGAERVELLGQRLAHGLLAGQRAMHDEVGRQRRLRAILDAVAATPGAGELDDLLAAHDETLADGGGAAAPAPPGALRSDLLRQRIAHGLLRAAREPDAVQRRERRIGAILDAVSEQAAGRGPAHGQTAAGPRPIPRLWRRSARTAVAAALVIAAGLALRALLGGGTDPLLEAASRSLGGGDRRFELVVDRVDRPAVERLGTHQLWLNPTNDGLLRFRLHLDGRHVGRQQVGSDGHVLWRLNPDDGRDREVVPLAGADAMLAAFGQRIRSHGEIADPDHFDIRRLLALLADEAPDRAELALEADGEDGLGRTYFFAELDHPDFGRLSAVVVLIDAGSRTVQALEFVRRTVHGVLRYRFENRGEDPRDAGFYLQPW